MILSLDSSYLFVLWSKDLNFGSFVLGLQFFFFFYFINLLQFGLVTAFEGKK